MGKVSGELDGRLAKSVSRQPVFFVATAPAEHNPASIDGLPALTNGATSPPGVRERSRR